MLSLVFAMLKECCKPNQRKPIKQSHQFIPNKWLPHPFCQTVISRILPCPRIKFERESIHFHDGVVCCLDVAKNKNGGAIILLIPGFAGSSASSYCKWFAKSALERGYTVVVYNRRAHVRESVSQSFPKHYDALDLDTVLDWIAHEFGVAAPLYGVGVSAGGNILMRHDGGKNDNKDKTMRAIVSVCNGYDVSKTVQHIEANPVLNQLFLDLSKTIMKNVTASNASNPFTAFKKFSDLERHVMGANLETYYYDSSSEHVIDAIKTPTLCINAADDPLVSYDYESKTFEARNSNISLLLTNHGGHVGYIDDRWKCDWWCERALDFIEQDSHIASNMQ